jgi:hypothetical protein
MKEKGIKGLYYLRTSNFCAILSSTPAIMMPFVVTIHMKGEEKRDSYCNYQMQGVQTKDFGRRDELRGPKRSEGRGDSNEVYALEAKILKAEQERSKQGRASRAKQKQRRKRAKTLSRTREEVTRTRASQSLFLACLVYTIHLRRTLVLPLILVPETWIYIIYSCPKPSVSLFIIPHASIQKGNANERARKKGNTHSIANRNFLSRLS